MRVWIKGCHIIQVDPEDAVLLVDYKLYLMRGYVYAYSTEAPTPQPLHGLLLGRQNKGIDIDHINGDILDNRRCNLRPVTRSINQMNRHRLGRNNTSGLRGVSSDHGKAWRARITVDGETIYLGNFKTKEEAFEARQKAEFAYFGEVWSGQENLPKKEAA